MPGTSKGSEPLGKADPAATKMNRASTSMERRMSYAHAIRSTATSSHVTQFISRGHPPVATAPVSPETLSPTRSNPAPVLAETSFLTPRGRRPGHPIPSRCRRRLPRPALRTAQRELLRVARWPAVLATRPRHLGLPRFPWPATGSTQLPWVLLGESKQHRV
jgi:hypothetical protein